MFRARGRLGAALLTGVAVLALGAAPVAAESDNNPKADVQQNNSFCGADLPANPVIGFANFHRSGETVTVNFHLKGAKPNTTYWIQLWTGCTGYLGPGPFPGTEEVVTNKNGVANGYISVNVPSAITLLFATAYDPTDAPFPWSDTPAVVLAD